MEYVVISKKSCNSKRNLVSKGEKIKQVTKFKYLGYLITSDGRCISEISKRIGMAKDTFQKMKPILANRNISMATKIIKTYVCYSNGLPFAYCRFVHGLSASLRLATNPQGSGDLWMAVVILRIFLGIRRQTATKPNRYLPELQKDGSQLVVKKAVRSMKNTAKVHRLSVESKEYKRVVYLYQIEPFHSHPAGRSSFKHRCVQG
ncbi:RNA-directed DNA polymerase from mobile element jockey-like [Plakobranchus ocellatus]|uniref:RNA-directed DNA polymerase from mobile element jockey-like n=1 Tax=Plakobranchus ocellatus TaxID=259542 RepID=A0AAV3YRW2_9GAST|nr:RNA-directed DNA polymerase from mobile element jockey-like [Plakobranchus ocellatus]